MTRHQLYTELKAVWPEALLTAAVLAFFKFGLGI